MGPFIFDFFFFPLFPLASTTPSAITHAPPLSVSCQCVGLCLLGEACAPGSLKNDADHFGRGPVRTAGSSRWRLRGLSTAAGVSRIHDDATEAFCWT